MAQRGFQEANETLIQVNRDLEEQIVERQLAEAAAEVARDEADRANKAKSEFLSRMSHELRTPLNAVLGFAQLLGMESLEPDQREGVEQILRAGRHLLDLINEVLDIARIESGRLAMTVETVPVDQVVAEVLELVSPLAAGRAVTLSQASSPRPLSAVADHKRLRQVLLNLVSNAIKYNHDGGTVTIASEDVAAGRLRIVVTDTGRGIDPDKMERLFSPFDRLGAEETSIEGTGLGLAVSKAMVDAMGGQLEATSEPGVGSSFVVELPRAAQGFTGDPTAPGGG
jgi:signal transduction histidine kinase